VDLFCKQKVYAKETIRFYKNNSPKQLIQTHTFAQTHKRHQNQEPLRKTQQQQQMGYIYIHRKLNKDYHKII
jgi:hypothetical protein